MKIIPLILGFLVLSSLSISSHADFFTFQDNTYKYSLRCCNSTGYCIDMEDISYINNDTEIQFNTASLSGDVVCFEVGNKMDINIKDAVLSSPYEIILFMVVVVFFIVVLGFIYAKVRGKKG